MIRGDINAITQLLKINKNSIGSNVIIGDNTVIHTAASLPTGIPAVTSIGNKFIYF